MKTHREIAEQMDLFHSEPDGPGMIFWHPRGWRLFRNIKNHMRRIYERSGFEEISTPVMLKKELWETSGHWEKFMDNMFVGGEINAPAEYAVKPMSCPAHILHYKRGVYSYRNLPYRVFEFGTVHRNEPSGSLNGCLRLRQFTQDDAHVFCDWEQTSGEIRAFLERARQVYSDYGFYDLQVHISTQPENSFGDQSAWQRAEAVLANACAAGGYEYEFQAGEGAFYGPKIEIALQDGAGRQWQCGTIQLDFNLPERFDISYVGEGNIYARPVILHQAMYGSLERWLGILLESYQGKLPAWIHPQPVAVASIGREAVDYAVCIGKRLLEQDIHALVDVSNETIGRKIRSFHGRNIPYVLVVGRREVQSESVSIRFIDGRNDVMKLGQALDFIAMQMKKAPQSV